ncbi:hypothetical protein [Thiofaba sp. EF100]|uniref:hypothetical protein n=1 Tax=Thiofaba sp. EF100 TaxID=3121274 RepID=UPI003221CBAC
MKNVIIRRVIQAMPQGMGLGFSSGAERIAEAAAKVKAPGRSDLSALRSDWMKLGGDFRGALSCHTTPPARP